MELIGMKSQSYTLRNELDEGLRRYGEDNNLSPISIIEELVEDFLCSKDYLHFQISQNNSRIEKIKNTRFDKRSGAYEIRRRRDGKMITYGSSKSPAVVKDIITFLESKEWDVKYYTKNTGLRGVEQINFLLSEMENDKQEG